MSAPQTETRAGLLVNLQCNQVSVYLLTSSSMRWFYHTLVDALHPLELLHVSLVYSLLIGLEWTMKRIPRVLNHPHIQFSDNKQSLSNAIVSNILKLSYCCQLYGQAMSRASQYGCHQNWDHLKIERAMLCSPKPLLDNTGMSLCWEVAYCATRARRPINQKMSSLYVFTLYRG